MTTIFKAVAAFIPHPTLPQMVLAVSRKTDHNNLGLCGGKIDPGETPEQAMIRECQEEIGITPTEFEPIFDDIDRSIDNKPFPCRTFLIKKYNGVIESKESALVTFVHPVILLQENCTFKEYNKKLFKHIDFYTLPKKDSVEDKAIRFLIDVIIPKSNDTLTGHCLNMQEYLDFFNIQSHSIFNYYSQEEQEKIDVLIKLLKDVLNINISYGRDPGIGFLRYWTIN